MEKAKTKRNAKDSVFTKLFSEKEKLLELYNAIENTNYGMDTNIRITTLKSALVKGRLNDISFVIDGKLVVLIEHQSTINENMPLRMLIYSSDVYKKLIPRKTLYSKKRIPVPKPEFIVMYNGKDEFPDHGTYKLSDMFAELDREGLGSLELEVEVYNINNGRNAEMVKRSEALKGYSFFISLLREYGKTMDRDSAVERATRECIRQNVLKEFLEEHASEMLNMLYGWNEEEAREVEMEEAREEGWEKGWEKGCEEGREEGIAIGEAKGVEKVFALLAQGISAEEAKRKLAVNSI